MARLTAGDGSTDDDNNDSVDGPDIDYQKAHAEEYGPVGDSGDSVDTGAGPDVDYQKAHAEENLITTTTIDDKEDLKAVTDAMGGEVYAKESNTPGATESILIGESTVQAFEETYAAQTPLDGGTDAAATSVETQSNPRAVATEGGATNNFFVGGARGPGVTPPGLGMLGFVPPGLRGGGGLASGEQEESGGGILGGGTTETVIVAGGAALLAYALL